MLKPVRNLVGSLLLLTVISTMVQSQSLTAGKVTQTAPQKQHAGGLLSEEFSFVIKDFRINHQGENNTLNILISYRYVVNIANADYPDFRWLAKDVETLLGNYPNKTDYWEIVNKQITALLLKKYPAIASLTCELKVDPTSGVPYSRSSRVTRTRMLTRNPKKV